MSADTNPTPRSWQCTKVIAYVKANSGCDGWEVADALGWSRNYIRKLLTVASLGGAIGNVRGAKKVARWFPASKMAAARQAELVRQKSVKRMQDAARAAKKRSQPRPVVATSRRQVSIVLPRVDDEDDGKPIRRNVPVHAPLPFQLTAHCSVFELGVAIAAKDRAEKNEKAEADAARREKRAAPKTRGAK